MPIPRTEAPSAVASYLERAGTWFLASGIQEPDGGVARYYRADLKRNHGISTEITGYAVSTLVYLYSLTGDERYLDAATQAGRFLARSAWNSESAAFPFEPQDDRCYFFDSGIIVRGLLAVWRATGDREYLDVAAVCGRAMARDFADGADYHPVLALPGKTPLPRGPRWSQSPGCYQLKAALAWHELAEETRDAGFARLYDRAVSRSLETHAAFLPASDDPDQVMDRLHAYCYFLEGLLPRLYRRECADVAKDGLETAERFLRQIAPHFARSDVYAQLLRMRIYAGLAGAVPVDRPPAESEAAALAEFQIDAPDTRVDGGFCFGRKDGQLLPYVNPVSTAFGLQALAMWEAYRAGGLEIAPHSLI